MRSFSTGGANVYVTATATTTVATAVPVTDTAAFTATVTVTATVPVPVPATVITFGSNRKNVLFIHRTITQIDGFYCTLS